MTESSLFLTGVGISLAASFLVLSYLRAPLDRILIELCATVERARFWSAFSAVSLVLVPLIFALDFRADYADTNLPVIAIATQLKWALIGLTATATLLAFTLSQFIPRAPTAKNSPAPMGGQRTAGGTT